MKKIILTLAVTALLTALFVVFASAQTPQTVDTVYETADVPVADIIVTQEPYFADFTGEEDCSAVIQRAIDDCAAGGGGTVFMPAGKYRFTKGIYIRQFVTLRGDWQDPDRGTDYGTVILADVESADVMTPGLIEVGASSGAVGLTVFYPNQSLGDVKPYPFTFYIRGNGDYMLSTVMNCTLLNSYRGIGACSECENDVDQCHEMLTVENVKGTCLYEGLNSHNSADVDTYKTIYFSGKYWSEAGKDYNAPPRKELDKYTRAHTCAMALGDLEWPEFCNIRISDCRYGIQFRKGLRFEFSGTFYDLYITDCDYGYYAARGVIQSRGRQWGHAVCRGVIEGSRCAVYAPGDETLLLTDVKVSGLCIGKNIRRTNADTDVMTPDYGANYTLPSNDLYVISADRTGKTDASSDIQAVLDAAAEKGGIAYLPAGLYRLDAPISVPAGVELRGSSSVPVRCQSGNSSGTLILSYYGYHNGDLPLITLKGPGSGLSGLRVDHLLNAPVDKSGRYAETSPTVYSQANNIHVINCAFTLASVGIKLENVFDAYIKRVVGCCCESMFSLKGCGNVKIECCLQNGNTLPRNGYAQLDIPEARGRFSEKDLFDFVFIPITRIKTDYIVLVDSENVWILNTFIYGGRSFLSANNSSVNIVNIGSDGSSKLAYCMSFKDSEVNAANVMRSTSDGTGNAYSYKASGNCKLRIYNRLGVGLKHMECPVISGISRSGISRKELLTFILQPLYRVIEKI